MFHTSYSSHSHLDLDIIEIRRRIEEIKEKNSIFRQSLKQDNKVRKKSLRDEELKEKISANLLDDEEISTVEMCHKKIIELVRTVKNRRLKSKLSIKPTKRTAIRSTPSSFEVLELGASPISNKEKSLTENSSVVKTQHSANEKKQENELSDSRNELEVIEVFVDSDSILSTPVKNKIEKKKDLSGSQNEVEVFVNNIVTPPIKNKIKKKKHSCSVVANTFNLDSYIDKNKPKIVFNNNNLKNINNLQDNSDTPYHSNLLNSSDRNLTKSATRKQYLNTSENNVSEVLDSCKQSKLSLTNKKDFVHEKNIDLDVICLNNVSLSSNVRERKTERLTHEKFTCKRKNEAICRNKKDKKQCKNIVKPILSNNISVISDHSVEENEINVCPTSGCHLKAVDFSNVNTVADDTVKKIHSNVTFLKNVESPIPEICIEESEEDHFEDIQILNENLGKHSEYIVPFLDFEEEPVDFPVPFLHTLGIISLSAEKVKTMRSQGVIIINGPFSKQEETLIKRNLKDFQSQFKVYNTRLLLGIGRQLPIFKDEYSNVKRFLKAKHFYERLGKDINNRHLHSIYKKARSLFSPFTKKKGKCRASEVAKIIQLQGKYGNKWGLIGQILGLDSTYCERIFTYHKKPVNKGCWSEREIKSLVSAIKSTAKTPDFILNWEKVADLVPSRNGKQCNGFWTRHNVQLKKKFFTS